MNAGPCGSNAHAITGTIVRHPNADDIAIRGAGTSQVDVLRHLWRCVRLIEVRRRDARGRACVVPGELDDSERDVVT